MIKPDLGSMIIGSDGNDHSLGGSREKPSQRPMEEVTGLLLFFAGSQPLFVLRLSRKEECRLAFGPTFASIAACLLMRM